jgi:nitrogen fixation protein NifQ
MASVYAQLMACPGTGDPFDRHVFACILAKGACEPYLPSAVGLGLGDLADLLGRHFPGAEWVLDGLPADADRGEDAIEEPDYRALLAGNATLPGSDEARWLAAMVARRSLRPGHLWEDLGLANRQDLSGLLLRHFGPIAARNLRDMKWKKFFYRQMCEAEGIVVCKSPICDECSDFHLCFRED